MLKLINTKFGTAKLNKNGYYVITNRRDGNHNKFLHRLIYEDFYGKIPNDCVIHHKDKNPINNCIMNLQLLSKREHMKLHKTGENNHFYGKHFSKEHKQNLSKSHKGKIFSEIHKKRLSEINKGKNNPNSKYTLWDNESVHFSKSGMFNCNEKGLNPRKCFVLKYGGKKIPIGYFLDFVSIEIISNLCNKESISDE